MSEDLNPADSANLLSEIELQDDDLELLEGDATSAQMPDSGALPVLAVIGRPNVGKSTLVNRILGRRAAVVQDQPGVTRDRVRYQAQWAGKDFQLLDTGGWELGVKGLDQMVAAQAEASIQLADAVLFVTDAQVGATETDMQIARILQRCNKPVILVANKVDSERVEADAAALWSLGLGEPFPLSALHGRGSGDLLDKAIGMLPEESQYSRTLPEGSPGRVALIGRPNVGKSSLLNALAGSQRVVVNELAGTTRDPVDEVIEIAGVPWTFVDTAGIRRRMLKSRGADFYASLRTQAAIEEADVAMVLLDASQPLASADIRIIEDVISAGRALVLVNNKWDLLDEERRHDLEREWDLQLSHVDWAPRINLSAKTAWHTNRIQGALAQALAGWNTRITTSELNTFLGRLVAEHPHPVRGGKQPRIMFATQVSAAPPRFVLFTTGFLDPSYRRFIEHRLREEYGFIGSPIQISVRVRERRKR
ncbi:ribosome biogenesis GTPase Der [Varibaculum cambriense]|uniref:ribosome biogenesis GTPase Der n=1 Tax=Varibaculum cambriense TaxID=184870 RepID=UPI002906F2FD|nr:ribosome biogenesis GTPase Der [Varibaculum cambriense]MDU3273995.1 ribosome biogenesis GTPase Der [Varibaculum cambriense]MDU5542708.1 ribosome biogenesis GTPase Der [Varibaculum cambriense]